MSGGVTVSEGIRGRRRRRKFHDVAEMKIVERASQVGVSSTLRKPLVLKCVAGGRFETKGFFFVS
ncbi:hypothetical protein NP92_14575 [Anoxybacillus gonensis]|nr:hypothetical protein NP92_14575 [Anoxybacillus gonensis]